MFVQLTGRRDLVTEVTESGNTYYEDDGADFFIRAGLRYLDRLTDLNQQTADVELTVPSGDFVVPINRFRAVRTVRIVRDGKDDEFLRRVGFKDFKKRSRTGEYRLNSIPIIYTLAEPSRDLPQGQTKTERKMMILPSPDEETTLGVRGLFSSRVLTNDDDVNWWTLNMPETLIQAGWYSLERFYRNRAGMKDHQQAIQQDIRNFKADEYQEEAFDSDQMANSEV